MWWKKDRERAQKQLAQSKAKNIQAQIECDRTDRAAKHAEEVSKKLLAEVETNGFTEMLREAWGAR